jgi:nucleobase transporter 1/2
LIVAVGLSNLQYINLNSERNLFIVGFSIFNAMSVAGPSGYFSTQDSNPFGDSTLAEIALAVFSSPMFIALLSAMFLDNTIEGSSKDRGTALWSKARGMDVHNNPEYIRVYGLPRGFATMFHNCGYLEYFGLGHFPDPPADGIYGPGQGDLGEMCWGSRHQSQVRDGDENKASVNHPDKAIMQRGGVEEA